MTLTKAAFMNDEKIKMIFQVVGGILGILAFLWNLTGYIWTYILSHLQIDISNEKIKIEDKEKLKVTTTVENKGSIAKKIDFAFLLIAPDSESFKSSLTKIAKQTGLTDEDADLPTLLQYCAGKEKQLSHLIIDQGFAIYPLPFFHEEQFQIGNEKVKYSCIIELDGFQKAKVYNIRFVTVSKHLFKTYLRHRSTSDLFIL